MAGTIGPKKTLLALLLAWGILGGDFRFIFSFVSIYLYPVLTLSKRISVRVSQPSSIPADASAGISFINSYTRATAPSEISISIHASMAVFRF